MLAAAGCGAAAAAEAPARFVVLAGGTEVLDRSTRLVWRRCAEGMQPAGDRCTGKAARGGNSEPGTPPWRLPLRDELATLILSKAAGRAVIDTAAFPDMPTGNFVAAQKGFPGDLMPYVDFSSGFVGASRPLFNFLSRLVRAATPEDLAAAER